VTDLVPKVNAVLEEFVPSTAEAIEMVEGRVCLANGTITPCWSYAEHESAVLSHTRPAAGVPGAAEEYDSFGNATAAGDFNGDGYADLAVASYQETTNAGQNAGSVTVFFGRPLGWRSR
jgi:hypothetical protein